MRRTSIALLAILTASVPAWEEDAKAAECRRGALYVTADVLNVRVQPSTGTVVGQLKRGDQVNVLECDGSWARIAGSQWVHSDYLGAVRARASSPARYSSKAAHFRDLRDQGIRLLGWVAGNSYGHPVWPEVEPYVSRHGQYYDYFVRLAPLGLTQREKEAEAFYNVNLYEEWFEKGQAEPFNEDDNVAKVGRMLQLAREVVAVYQ